MSYEGYREYLCKNGHYFSFNVWNEPEKPECPCCGNPPELYHGVDQTNGYDESNPYTCDAPKIVIGFDDKWHEDHYGNKYATKIMRYRPRKHWKRYE